MDLATKMQQSMEALTAQIAQMQTELRAIDEMHATKGQLVERLEKAEAQITETKSSVDSMRLKMNIISAVAGILLPIASFFGIYSYREIMHNAQSYIDKNAAQLLTLRNNAFYDDLLSGTALWGNEQYGPATTRLMNCFQYPEHHYETSLLVPLLSSLYRNDDWDRAIPVIKTLKENDQKYQTISDPFVYVLIGSIEIQGSREHSEWLADGWKDLEKGRGGMPTAQSDAIQQIYINRWVYHLQTGQTDLAEDDIKVMKELPVEYGTWRSVKTWKFFQSYLKEHTDSEQRLKLMWDQLPKRS